MKTREAIEGFHLLENSHKHCRGFHQAMKAWITCFISFIKLLFAVLTKRKTIYEARMYLYFFHETVTFPNLEIEPTILTTFINGGYFSILLFKFAWLASFGLKYSFEFFSQRRGQPGKFEYRQKNTKIAAIYENGLFSCFIVLWKHTCRPIKTHILSKLL